MHIQANKGLFVGLFVASAILVGVICYFMFDDVLFTSENSYLLYFATEILLLAMLTVVVIAVSVKFQRLRFTMRAESCMLDQSLLVIAVFGLLALECFHLVSALHVITTRGLVSALSTVTAVLSSAQVSHHTMHSLYARVHHTTVRI